MAPRRSTRRLRRLAVPLAIVLLGAAASAAAGAEPDAARAGRARAAVPGELIVRFRPGVDAAGREAARERSGVGFDQRLRLRGRQLVAVEPGRGTAAAEAALERDPRVLEVQPNYVYRAAAAPLNDSLFGSLWGLTGFQGVGALRAWDLGQGAGTRIAVLDTGVASHPDLAGNRLGGGFDHVAGDADPNDESADVWHGTHVSGTAAAVGGNARGIAGVAYRARILPERVLDADGMGTTTMLANGLVHAANSGVDVANMSVGGGSSDPAVDDALRLAASRGVVNVAAAGNLSPPFDVQADNEIDPTYPCNSPWVHVCVAAIDEGGNLAGSSNYGSRSVDVGAPGMGILSTVWGPGGEGDEDYASADGSSMASPHVAGVAAIIAGLYPSATPGQLARLIIRSAVPLPSLQGVTVSGGHATAAGAIDRAIATRPACRAIRLDVPARGVRVRLRCSDADGEPFALQIASGPRRGSLGGLDQARDAVRYKPRRRFAGRDSFSFRASDGILAGAAAVVTLRVDPFRPGITRLSMLRRVFGVSGASTPIGVPSAARRRRLKRGSAFRFRLSERAGITIRIQRRWAGVWLGRRCRRRTRSALRWLRLGLARRRDVRRLRGAARTRALRRLERRRRCTIYRSAGRALMRRGRRGRNSVRFSGRIGRRALAPGGYRALIRGRDAAGNRSREHRVGFRIVR